MASRKTYFGIGLPKDPTDPPRPLDPADQSSPTVVDDEKVAEGLKQLRSWYQEASSEDDTRRVVAPPVQATTVQATAAPVMPQARPTAVGHATGEAPPQTQRPVAPDPMRATMFGHDVHRFDLEAYMAANASPPAAETTPITSAPPPPAEERPYRRSDPPRQPYEARQPHEARQPYETRQPYEARHNVDGVPRPAGSGSQSGASQLADFLRRQERPNQAAFRMSSLDDTDAYPSPRVPMSARIVLVAGLAALTVAVVFWIRSRASVEPSAMPGAPLATPVAPGPAPGFRPWTAMPVPAEGIKPAIPALPRVPSETAAPVVPVIPSVPVPIPAGEATTTARKISAAAVAPATPTKAPRRTRIATAPRPSADAPEQPGGEAAKGPDESAAAGASDQGSAAPPRNESPPRASEKTREKRAPAVEKDSDATLPPSAE